MENGHDQEGPKLLASLTADDEPKLTAKVLSSKCYGLKTTSANPILVNTVLKKSFKMYSTVAFFHKKIQTHKR